MALSDCVVLTATEPVDSSLAITVTLTAIVLTQGGVNVPALQGTWAAPTDTRVLGVQFEYQESGANASRTAAQGVDLLKWVATDGLIPGKTYAVRYRAVGVDNYGSWTSPANKTLSATLTASEVVNQGDLAILDQVDTPQIVTDAVTTDKVDTGAVNRISADQTAGLGANCVNRSGASDPAKRALVKTYNFTVDSTGKISIQFLTHVELKSSNRLYFYLKVTSEAAATWTTDNVMTNADLSWEFQAGNNDRLPSTGIKVFSSGLTPGAATVEVYWNDGGSGAHNHECNNPVFEIKEFKKAA